MDRSNYRKTPEHGTPPKPEPELAAERRPRENVACPLCGNVIQVEASATSVQVACDCCGLAFSSEARRATSEAGVKAISAKPGDVGPSEITPAEQLERWLAGEPIRPHALTPQKRFVRWCRERPYAAAIGIGGLASLILAAALGCVGYWYATAKLAHVEQVRQESEQRRRRAELLAAEKTRQAGEQLRQAQTALAAREVAERRWREAERARRKAEQQRREAEQQQVEAASRARVSLAAQLALESRQCLLTNPHRAMFLAGESMRALLRENHAPDPDLEQVLRDALSLTGGQALVGHRGAIQALTISPDGRWLASGSRDTTVRLWDFSSPNPELPVVLNVHSARINALTISNDGRWLVSADSEANLYLWDLEANDVVASGRALHHGAGRISAVAVSPDGRWLLAAGGCERTKDFAARLWNLDEIATQPSTRPYLLRGHTKSILCVAMSPNSRWAATGGEDSTVRVYDLTARFPAAEQIVLEGHEGWIEAMAFTPDSNTLATGSYDSTTRLWDLAAADPRQHPIVLRGHEGWVSSVAASPDGHTLATGSFDKTLRLWNLDSPNPAEDCRVLEGHEGRIRQAVFSPDGRWLISGSFDRTVRLWDLDAQNPALSPFVLRGHEGPVSALVVSADSRWMATGSGDPYGGQDTVVRLWDLQLEGLLDTARALAARTLPEDERQRLLLEAANQTEETVR